MLRASTLFCGVRQAWEQVYPQLRLQLVHTDHIPLQSTLDLVQVGVKKAMAAVSAPAKHSLPAVLRDAHRAAMPYRHLEMGRRHIDTAICRAQPLTRSSMLFHTPRFSDGV